MAQQQAKATLTQSVGQLVAVRDTAPGNHGRKEKQ